MATEPDWKAATRELEVYTAELEEKLENLGDSMETQNGLLLFLGTLSVIETISLLLILFL